MNALILANRLPFPLDDGWKVRTWHIVEAVASIMPTTLMVGQPDSSGHLAEAREALGPRGDIATFRLGRRNSLLRLVAGTVTPFPVLYWNEQSVAARREVRELCQERRFDVGIAVLTYLWPYLRYLGPDARRIVDTHNVDSTNMDRYVETLPLGPHRAYAALTARKLRRLEAQVFSEADDIWVCSEEDAAAVTGAVPAARTHVVPNGVDTTRFAPAAVEPEPATLLFFGRLDYFPNQDGVRYCLREILPMVRKEFPEARLEIVGPGAGAELAEAIRGVPGAVLRGRVDDVPRVLAQATVVVVPLRAGGGTRLKILEALASARPVVSTSIGAEGLLLTHGEDLLIADDPAEFACRVVELLRDPAKAAKLGARGRETVRRRYEWSLVRDQVAGLLLPDASPRDAEH